MAKLVKLELELQKWGDLRGSYLGSVKFETGEGHSFSLKIDDEACKRYLAVVSENVVKSASELGAKLAADIGLETSSLLELEMNNGN